MADAPPVPHHLVDAYLATAKNRLAGVRDQLRGVLHVQDDEAGGIETLPTTSLGRSRGWGVNGGPGHDRHVMRRETVDGADLLAGRAVSDATPRPNPGNTRVVTVHSRFSLPPTPRAYVDPVTTEALTP